MTAPAGDGPRTDTAERLAEAPECGSNIRIADGEAHAFAVCLRPAGHDEPHGNGDLRWARLDQAVRPPHRRACGRPVTAPRPAGDGEQQLRIVPVTFADACAFVAMWHRHHQPPVGHKFSIGVVDQADRLVGVAIVGRPIARLYDDGMTLEVNRTATDGTPNANSALYGAAWRAAKALGYRRLVTYTQSGESGASLRGAGWQVVAQRPARPGWNMPSRPREDRGVDHMPRTLWEATA